MEHLDNFHCNPCELLVVIPPASKTSRCLGCKAGNHADSVASETISPQTCVTKKWITPLKKKGRLLFCVIWKHKLKSFFCFDGTFWLPRTSIRIQGSAFLSLIGSLNLHHRPNAVMLKYCHSSTTYGLRNKPSNMPIKKNNIIEFICTLFTP